WPGPRRTTPPVCSRSSSPGPGTRSSSASASTTGASAPTVRWATSSASPPRRPGAWSSEPSTRSAPRPRPASPPHDEDDAICAVGSIEQRDDCAIGAVVFVSSHDQCANRALRPEPGEARLAPMLTAERDTTADDAPAWRALPAAQQPDWPDPGALDRVT